MPNVTVRDMQMRREHVQIDENDILVESYVSFLEPDQFFVRLLWEHGGELAVKAASRGEGLVDLGNHLVALGKALKIMALAQEGCTGLTVGDLSKP